MSKEAMELALEALEYTHEGANNQGPHTGISWRCVSNKTKPAIIALREALNASLAEQPAQQEPEYWLWACGQHIQVSLKKPEFPDATPLYTSPPTQRQWVGLTQQDIDIAFDDTQEGGGFDDFSRAIEAKLKEKNA